MWIPFLLHVLLETFIALKGGYLNPAKRKLQVILSMKLTPARAKGQRRF
jgi:hypothetical protein